jgi:hypothetical protein
MTLAPASRTDRYQRYSRRGMLVVLALAVLVGALTLAVTLDPDGGVARGLPRFVVVVPVAIALIAGGLYSTLRGDRWDPRSPEAQALLGDEWRQQTMARAMRGAFGVVLAAQAPLAVWLASRPAPNNVIAMAIVTMSLGLAALCTLFLVFDRRGDDVG